MYELLFNTITSKVAMDEAELEQIKFSFIPKKLRRRQYLLQEGDVCKYNAFVNKGCLRAYTIDTRGQEVIFRLSMESNWILDPDSFINGNPSLFHIDALEDSELLLIDHKSWNELMDKNAKFERYVRLMLEDAAIANQYRTIANISMPAEERYSCFANNYPAFIQRIPQHMIASFLGMTPETLSRIRNINGK